LIESSIFEDAEVVFTQVRK